MLSHVRDDRDNLIALARLYCENCDVQMPAAERNGNDFLLSRCVADILSDTHCKLRDSVKIIKTLRSSFLIDEEKSQALLQQLIDCMNERGTAEDRSVQIYILVW